jgi:hypothetical protein
MNLCQIAEVSVRIVTEEAVAANDGRRTLQEL